jgi:hypothetical protein
MPIYTDALRPMACLIDSYSALSIESVTIAQNQDIVVGQVLGSIGLVGAESASAVASPGNIGNGSISAVTTTPAATNGRYTILMLSTGTVPAPAEFDVQRPDGGLDGSGQVGTPYAGQIGFTITAGSTNFALGDSFAVTVTRPPGPAGEQFEAWNPTAADGSQNAAAIALYPASTANGQTASIAALKRNGAVRASDLTWNASATSVQIAYARQQLAAKSIVLR